MGGAREEGATLPDSEVAGGATGPQQLRHCAPFDGGGTAVPPADNRRSNGSERGDSEAGAAKQHAAKHAREQPAATNDNKRARCGATKCLPRRPEVLIRPAGGQGGLAWLRVHDVEFGCLRSGPATQEEKLAVSQALLANFVLDPVRVGDETQLHIDFGGDRALLQARVVQESSPALTLGDQALRWLHAQGWRIDSEVWLADDRSVPAPIVHTTHLEMGEMPDGVAEDVDGESGSAAWEDAIDAAQRHAVEGEEPGGLVAVTAGWAPPSELLREAGRVLESVAKLEAGPTYSTAEDNPPEFKSRAQDFVPGLIHHRAAAWHAMDPRPDAEVLAWVDRMYEVQEHPSAVGLSRRNGAMARKNPDALQDIVMKRLREGSYEFAPEPVTNILSLNLVDKPGASPPFRLIVDPSGDFNDSYNTWKVRYEGTHTVPLTVKEGDWLLTLDLNSGYDACLMQPRSRNLFGFRVRFSATNLRCLRSEGLLQEAAIETAHSDGSATVILRHVTLVQGWKNSCGVFTKLTRQLTRMWRKRGYRMAHLLDDFLFAVSGTEKDAEEVRDAVIADLESLGLFVSWKKSVLRPSKAVRFLGFVVDSERMRFFVPGEKIEEIRAMVRSFQRQPTEVTFRRMAKLAGKIISLGTAIAGVRLFTRETYKCICPEDSWDEVAPISDDMMKEILEAFEWLPLLNQLGGPIRRPAKQLGLRLMMDASVDGFGYRLDGVCRDIKLRPDSYMVAAQWSEDPWENQAHRELAALLEILEGGHHDGQLRGQRLLVWTDSVATKAYINKGSGPSAIMSSLMKRIWRRCMVLGCSVFAEHVAGTLLVEAGVDASSRATEFSLAKAVFNELNGDSRFGRQGGFQGFTVDALASQRTRQLQNYFSRGGVGTGSLGDFRTATMQPDDNFFVCPPLGLLEAATRRIHEAGVAATMVVPNWEGKAWHLWLRQHASAIQLLPWRDYPPTWLDLSEKKPKPHVLAQRWEFVAIAVDFREGGAQPGVKAVGRAKDRAAPKPPLTRLEFGGASGVRRPPRGQPQVPRSPRTGPQVVRILSLCGGMGTVGYAAAKLQRIFGQQVQFHVVEVEIDPAARRMCQHVTGGHTQHAQPSDLWEWAVDEKRTKQWIKALGTIHWVVCGFSCQDMSVAHRKGQGLKGDRSSVYFAAYQLLQWTTDVYAEVDFTFECTVFKHKHPRDWDFVAHHLGASPQLLEAGWVSPAWRHRAFWSSFTFLQLEKREAPPESILGPGRRPTWRWRDKLPTITAAGPASWNHKACIQSPSEGAVVEGPLRISEVERAMGFAAGSTDSGTHTERQRWKCLGNAIHAAVMAHIMVSMLVAKGYITRDDVRLKGQVWTINQDGPHSLRIEGELEWLADSDKDGDDDTEYKVEKILAERGSLRRGTKQYLCQFLGYPVPTHEQEDYWVWHSDMYGCERLIDEWLRRQGKKASQADGDVGRDPVPDAQQPRERLETGARSSAAGQARRATLVKTELPTPLGDASTTLTQRPPIVLLAPKRQPSEAAAAPPAAAPVPLPKPAKAPRSKAKQAMQLVPDAHVSAPRGDVQPWKEVFSRCDASGVPVTLHTKRKMGLDKPDLPTGPSFWRVVDEMATDYMVMSRAENTWRQYAAWWSVFVEWGNIMGVDVATASLAELRSTLLRSLVLMFVGGGYAASTLEIYTTAVASRLKDTERGDIRAAPEVSRLLEGISRKIGRAVTKKLPAEAKHVSALMRMDPPDNDGASFTGIAAGTQWHELVTVVVIGWGAYLRTSEILDLQVCDLTWLPNRVDICVKKAKADQRGITATTELERADAKDSLCMYRYLRDYLNTCIGGCNRAHGCVKQHNKNYHCPVCPYVFPHIGREGVEPRKQLAEKTLRDRLKKALHRLEQAGVVEQGLYQHMSLGSLRKGGNSTAAAYGIRDVLREKHGRWGLTARKHMATAEPEYNMALSAERGAVAAALHQALNDRTPQGARPLSTDGVNSSLGRALVHRAKRQRGEGGVLRKH